MKSTAAHYHSDGSECWYDWGPEMWFRYPPEDAELDLMAGIIPGVPIPCPDPAEPDMPEIGRRDEAMVAGSEPYTPPPVEEVVFLEAEGVWAPLSPE